MRNRVYLGSLESLQELDDAFARFAQQCMVQLNLNDSTIPRKIEQILRQCNERRADLESLQKEYQASGGGEGGNLRAEISKLEKELGDLREQLDQIEQFRHNYYLQSRRLADLATNQTLRARAFLQSRLIELQDFINIKVDNISLTTNNPNPPSSSTDGNISKDNNSDNDEQENLVILPAGINEFPLPAGFIWLSLARIAPKDIRDLPERDQFRKVSYQEIQRGLSVLRETILPALKEHELKIDAAYFHKLDESKGDDYACGCARVFNAFFRSSPSSFEHIQLARKKNERYYSIINGRRRIKVAIDAGWTVIPAEAMER
jgi:hypothetical protein